MKAAFIIFIMSIFSISITRDNGNFIVIHIKQFLFKIPINDSWIEHPQYKSNMEVNYDEDLSQNLFFQTLQKEHEDVLSRAIAEGCIICIPRNGTFKKENLTEQDFLGHILIPNDELPATHFHTLTNKEVCLSNKNLNVKSEDGKLFNIHLLFEETFYTEDYYKYCVWCVEGLLENESKTFQGHIPIVTNLKECINLIWSDSSNKNNIKDLDSAIEEFEKTNTNLSELTLEHQKDKVGVLFKKCLQILLNDLTINKRANESIHYFQTIKLTTEIYILQGLKDLLLQSILVHTAADDACLNKIIRNLSNIHLQDLGIRTDLYNGILRGKLELSRLNRYNTILGKINCLKRVVSFISQDHSITTDDLLPVLMFIIIKSGLSNWITQLNFMKMFRFSVDSENGADEAEFLITSLEAAVEHIKSGSIRVQNEGLNKLPNKIVEDNSEKIDKPIIIDILFKYVKQGNLEEVEKLLTNKSEITLKNDKILCHPLCLCEKCLNDTSENSDSDLLNLFCKNDQGLTLLHVACIYENLNIVEYLLKNNADPNEINGEGLTPLHYACIKGYENIVLILLNYKANYNTVDFHGNSALHLASDHGHENCVKTILDFIEKSNYTLNINQVNIHGDTSLHYASKWGYCNIVKCLLNFGADKNIKNKRGHTPLSLAHSIYIVRLLNEFNMCKNSLTNPKGLQGTISLYQTEQQKNFNSNIIKKKEVSDTTDGLHKIDRLFAAISEGDIHLALYYLGLKGPSNDEEKDKEKIEFQLCHPLCNCDKCKNIEEIVFKKDCNPPISINAVNSKGETSLHIACSIGYTEIIQILLDSGAKINVVTRSEGRTPLHLACMNNNIDAVKILLKSGTCNIDAKDNSRDTPLHLATRAGHLRIVELLLRFGANTKLTNLKGFTSLEEVEKMEPDDIFLSFALRKIIKI